ncbi:MAG: hypothetical protein MK207_13200 [Saprospiraceae bacterium]|nr:hypothetical protein [Saprospiraceae bacterium]
MKKIFLFCTYLCFMICVNSCEKAEKILLISNHKWVVTNDSKGGNPGEVYSFLDNRLFFFTTSSGSTIDGKWDFNNSDNINTIYIETTATTKYTIHKLTSDELELKPKSGMSTLMISLAPQPN